MLASSVFAISRAQGRAPIEISEKSVGKTIVDMGPASCGGKSSLLLTYSGVLTTWILLIVHGCIQYNEK
jgi:hypothetical protein